MDSNEKSGSEDSQVEPNEHLLDEAEALIWALLDDDTNPEGIKRLEGLLQENEQVRQRYISCVQMHADLHAHFGETKAPLTADEVPESPVLGSLGELRPGTDTWPPVAQ